MFSELLPVALGLKAGETPFAWQRRLFEELLAGRVPSALDLPTGLGKTSVMGLWLLARACGAALPRRLVYVVDRRAVVDQATRVAEELRGFVAAHPAVGVQLGLEAGLLPISTLRGQFVDNRAWLEDPASAAIVVGTVDMVGSRLLFEGYGVSRKMRPYHAGLLGNDALVVLDEAHLVPPFERLVESIAAGGARWGPKGDAVVDPLKLLSLSATGRRSAGRVFQLQADEVEGVVAKRLGATKRLSIEDVAGAKPADALSGAALALADRHGAARIIVFCTSRADADKVATGIRAGAKKAGLGEVSVELLVGGRRVREREAAASALEGLGFIAGRKGERTTASFLVATAAGEVGVDLDADHMVADVVAWERMVQRLGRVNRRGDGAAEVRVLVQSDDDAQSARLAALRALPAVDEGAAFDASPGAIRELKRRALEDAALAQVLEAATTPAPLYPALVRPLIESWAMTSLAFDAGRPIVAPWLRGWVDNDPQTTIVWRAWLPVRAGGAAGTPKETAAFFEAAPVHLSETLEAETWQVLPWLIARAESLLGADALAPDTVVAFVGAGDGEWTPKTLSELVPRKGDPRAKQALESLVSGATIIVDTRLGGLSSDGLLDEEESGAAVAADGDEVWLGDTRGADLVGFRVREWRPDADDDGRREWQERARFVVERAPTGEPTRVLCVDKWRGAAATEDDRGLTKRDQSLVEHQSWAERQALSLARRLGLLEGDGARGRALALAAKLHDEGKKSRRWQEAFNAPKDGGVYAKTRGPINQARLDGYRHELGSFLDARERDEVKALSPELRDLVLHLIVSHHGFARPVIGLAGVDTRPPSLLKRDAEEVAERFMRLTERWGPWGLAWWEAVLRAADQQASRDNDEAADARSAGRA